MDPTNVERCELTGGLRRRKRRDWTVTKHWVVTAPDFQKEYATLKQIADDFQLSYSSLRHWVSDQNRPTRKRMKGKKFKTMTITKIAKVGGKRYCDRIGGINLVKSKD
jgi:hypothetical protein